MRWCTAPGQEDSQIVYLPISKAVRMTCSALLTSGDHRLWKFWKQLWERVTGLIATLDEFALR